MPRLAAASAGITPTLLVGQIIELPAWHSTTPLTAVLMTLGCLGVSPVWALLLRSGCRRLAQCDSPWLLYLGVITWGYLIAPVAHYLLMTPPGYPHITAASNFFSSTWWLVLSTFLLALLQALRMNRIINGKSDRISENA